jgi:pyruvate/2-oxoglutarate dehydrogenase complex dihydrolipoamide acyltransferase (E2) component
MAAFTLPPLGGAGTDADIVKWLVKEGDHVEEGQPVLEVAFEKANVEVPATTSGMLTNIVVRTGDLVSVGQLLATIS